MKFKLKKSSRTTAGLLAGACFIGLAIYSWGLPVKTALLFLAFCLIFLVGIMTLAASFAYIIRFIRK